MSAIRNSIVGINGDGNAVGDNNQVTVVKQEKHVHHHQRPPEEGDGGGPLGIIVVAIAAIAASCYFFTRSSEVIYSVLGATAWVEVFAAVAAASIFSYREVYAAGVKAGAIALVCLAAALVVSTAADDYSGDIVSFSLSSPTFTAFWCGLSDAGRQLAMLHTLTATVLFAPALSMLMVPSLLLAYFAIFRTAVSSRIHTLVARLTSWPPVIVGGALIALAGYAHSDAGWESWTTHMKSPPTWPICPTKR